MSPDRLTRDGAMFLRLDLILEGVQVHWLDETLRLIPTGHLFTMQLVIDVIHSNETRIGSPLLTLILSV